MSNFTQGPWVVHKLPYATGFTYAVGLEATGPHHTLARVLQPTDGSHSAEANARLIAAAPDLLAALQEIDASEAAYEGNEEDDERCRNALAAARAALAKATS